MVNKSNTVFAFFSSYSIRFMTALWVLLFLTKRMKENFLLIRLSISSCRDCCWLLDGLVTLLHYRRLKPWRDPVPLGEKLNAGILWLSKQAWKFDFISPSSSCAWRYPDYLYGWFLRLKRSSSDEITGLIYFFDIIFLFFWSYCDGFLFIGKSGFKQHIVINPYL